MNRLWGVITMTFMFVFVVLTLEICGIEGKEKILTQNTIEVNKPHYDDTYDCVDFYKQPAFDHPLLVNHTFHHEMMPSSTPKMTRSETKLSLNIEVPFKGKGCPVGTVPIRKIKEEDLIRERFHFKKYGTKYGVLSVDTPGTHYATVVTRWSPTKKYNGGRADISSWNPPVQSSQYSSGQLVIRNGQDNIQVGWTVNPTLYGDNCTHRFIYTSAGATQCFNTQCPGFVIVNKDHLLDGLVTISKRGGKTFYVKYMIHKDAKDGNWWLRFGPLLTPIGFWPKNIFTGLSDMATRVEWGGQVYSPPHVPSPPMGSGEFIVGDTRCDAYCGFVNTINEAHEVVDAQNIDVYADTPYYQVKHQGNAGKYFGNLVYFGGPGGVTGN